MKHNLSLLLTLGGLLAAAIISAYALNSPRLTMPPFTLIWLFFILVLIACIKTLVDKTASAETTPLILTACAAAILLQAAFFGCLYYTLLALHWGITI